ncbi:uncharacterized protein LOC112454612 [Temnothorax curvispinosus]|uniref:Uncharacterized protein LOC112454612 n=1 Tax=Temnothorax curvispinosus TaxID=300111 RepID=A0A6J1PRI5_9HYME|nr:uncharacterized protein LOC112454612 [Temnothorax curvispinosus]
MDILTSNDELDNIQLYDSTIEIIGFVDGIEAPRYVGDKQQYKIFKFFLNNGNGKRIQIMTWNDEVDKVEPHIKLNYIIHLDGVQARPPKAIQFNNGNVPYELQVRSNTIVKSLGKYELLCSSNVEPECVQFLDVLNTSTRVTIEGFIKTNFAPVYNNKLNKSIGCGSLTDGEYKLEIHIMNFNEETYCDLELVKGDKIKMTGKIQTTVDPPYFIVQNLKDLSKIDGHMPLKTVIKVFRTLQKRSVENNSLQQHSNKKSKLD